MLQAEGVVKPDTTPLEQKAVVSEAACVCFVTLCHLCSDSVLATAVWRILGHDNQLRVLASFTDCRANQVCVDDVQNARDAASGLVSEKEKLAREAQRLQEVCARRVKCVACV